MSVKLHLVLGLIGWTHLGLAAITTSFEGGVPSQWNASPQWTTDSYDDGTYLRTSIAQSRSGTTGLVKSLTTVDESFLPKCDNVVAEVVLSNVIPADSTLIDSFQVVVATNSDWKPTFPVGEPFEYYESGSKDLWSPHRVMASIDGLGGCGEFYYGLKVIAAGKSSNNIFVKSLSLDFLAGATCTSINYIGDSDPLIGNESVIVAATIKKEPVDVITDLTVWAEIDRNGFVYTNQMFEAENGVYTNDVLRVAPSNAGSREMPPIDAGDKLKVGLFTKYASSMGAIGDPDGQPGRYVEKSNKTIVYEAPQLGSVWINEFSLDQVELLGTINRPYIRGWVLELVDADSKIVGRKVFGEAFNFATNMPNKMVGLLTFDLAWEIGETKNPYSLRLINAAGVIEHPIEGLHLTATGNTYGKVGLATWPKQGFAYDWSGTATNENVFVWRPMDVSSFGRVNSGQSFEVESKGWFQVFAYSRTGSAVLEGFEFANVNYEVEFSSGSVKDSEQTDSGGLTPFIEFQGAHTNEAFVTASYDVSAFGWFAERNRCVLSFGSTNDGVKAELSPTVARDQFSTGRLEPYWLNCGNRNFDYYEQSTGDGFIRFDTRRMKDTQFAQIKSKNHIKSRGKSCVVMSFEVRNDVDPGLENSDYAHIQIATDTSFSSESVVARSMVLSNKISGVSTGIWNLGTTIVVLPDGIDESSSLYVKVCGNSGYQSGVSLDVDNIRIAFQDMVEINDLRLTGEEKNIGFEIDAEPLCADGQSVSNVSVQVVMDVGGTVFTNFWASKSGAIATNLSEAMTFKFSPEAISAGLMAARGYPLREHETFKYWAQVTYYADSRDTDSAKEWETRYFPDNMTRESEDRWTVRGKYAIDMTEVSSHYTYSVPGGPISQNEGVELFVDDPTKAKFSVRAYDETGAGVTNVTVRLSTEGEEDKVFTTNVTGAICFDYDVVATGLVANAKYVVSVTGVNANGQQLTQDPFVFEFETLPEMPTAAIEAVSTSELKLTVSGKAAGYVVDAADWAQSSANTWVKGERTPNSLLKETILIYGTNQVGAVSVTNAFEASCYTRAAVATKAPVIEKGTVTVEVGADKDYVASDDDNPEGTEYAVRVTTSNGGDTLVTNGVGKAIWKTLKAWHDEPETLAEPTIDLTATNVFSFVTRNFDEIVTPNGKPVTVECDFPMTASFLCVGQQADPFGIVAITNVFIDPAKRTGATAEVEYKIGEGEWTSVSKDPIALSFDQIAQTNQLAWNAWEAVGQKEGAYAYQLHARVVSGTRSSEWTETSGTLDFVKPTATLFKSTTPDAFNVLPMKVTVTFSEPVVDFTSAAIAVDGEGMAGEPTAVAGQDNTYTFDVTPKAQGLLKVQIKTGQVKDRFGNGNVATDVLTKTFDVEAPKWDEPPITGTPANGSATNGTWYALAAHATDNLTAITYHWSFDQQTWKTGEEFKGDVEEENKYTVYVYVTDAAGNVSTTNEWSWTYDKSAPVWNDPAITGTPANGSHTNKAHFALTASAGDATDVTYYWSFDEQKWTAGQKFEDDVTDEKFYTVRVYAVDAADNVSTTNTWSWTYDRTPPDKPEISGSPANNSVTTNMEYALQAQSYDKLSQYTYHWTLGETVGHEDLFNGKVTKDDVYHASVYVVDEAGNVSETNFWNWTVDTTDPTEPVVSGTPGNNGLTNVVSFAYTAQADDKTKLKFYWKFGEYDEVVKEEDETFDESGLEGLDDLKDGVYAVSCYAVDEAKNVSKTNTIHWTLDRTPPTVTLDSATDDPFGKGTEFLEVSVVFSEPVVEFGTHSVSVDNGAQVASFEQTDKMDDTSYLVKIRPGDDGLITVKIEGEQVKDRAGNWNVASEPLTHTYDTTPPANYTFTSTPGWRDVVATSNFNFEVSATDTTTVTYYWKTNEADYVSLGAEKKDGDWVAKFEGLVSEGTNTLSVYGTDQLGNPTETNSIWWVVDMTPPELPEIIGDKPKKITKETGFDLTAKSTDMWTAITYHWTLKCGENIEDTGAEPTFAKSDLADGDYTVFVYAEDEAHNVSETNSWAWTVDTVAPTVTLKSSTPTTFNEYKVPLIVDVEFSEDVVGFTTNCVALENGVVTNLTGSGKSYTLFIDPRDENDDEAFVEVSVNIGENQVTDPAGNGNEAAKEGLTFKNVTKMPTVTFASTTHDPFNKGQLVLTATFVRGTTNVEAAVVTNFTADVISCTNGTVEVSPAFPTNVYTITVTPKADGVISIRIPAGVVADEVGNQNEASDLFTCMYDATAPAELAVSGTPEEGKVTASQDFELSASADDLTEVTYHWSLTTPDGVEVEDYCASSNFTSKVSMQVPKGTNTVSVYAVDAASNRCAAVSRTWIVDYEPPVWEDVAIYGEPGIAEVIVVTTNANFSYTAQATDATRITYHWWTNVAEVAVNPTNLLGTAIEGTNTVMAFATDEANNVSTTNEIVWVVDTIAPTNLVLFGKPAELTKETGFAMTAQADDKTILTYFWKLDKQEVATELAAGKAFDGQKLFDGEHTVTVYAKDEAENVSAVESWTWTVDTTAPEGLAISGKPTGEPFVISDPTVKLEASATDAVTPAEKIVYTWKFNNEDPVESETLKKTALEGTNTVSVWARDEMSNTCAAVTRTWVVDTLDPSNLQFVAEFPGRDVVTNGAAFAFTVQAEDATQLTYHWLTNGTEVVDHYDPSFGGTAFEGTNTVSVYAEDEAHNVSLTNSISWTYDFKAPSTPVIVEGAPMGGATNTTEFAFTAQSKDDWSNITYHWSLTDGKTATGQTFANNVVGDDGTYTMSVWAEDEAHNVSGTNMWSWTLDRVEPMMPTITGTPASNSYVNVDSFDLKARLEKDDATAVSFHWRLDEDPTETVASNFTDSVTAEGLHTAYVYARDAAGNVSETNRWSWTYDNTPPKLLPIVGTPENGSVTNGVWFNFQGQAQDDSPLTFHWKLDESFERLTLGDAWLKDKVAEGFGQHVMSYYVVDKAGNVSAETNFWNWTVDTLAPTNLTLKGWPANGLATTNTAYSFTAEALDDLELTYCWALDGDKNMKELKEGKAYAGEDLADGPHTVTVYARDRAGNMSVVTNWAWTVDTTAPELEGVWGLPISEDPLVVNLTNGCDFVLWAAASDNLTAITYNWSTNGIPAECTTSNFVGTVGEGTNWVTVAAKDAAGNVSADMTRMWVVDITLPTVTLLPEISTNKVINLADVTPDGFKVEVKFSEPVTGFTIESVRVDNGRVTAVEPVDAANYVVTVKPDDGYEGEEFAVWVEAGAVKDLAKNDNVASQKLTYKCDVKAPTVELDCDVPNPFGRVHLLSGGNVLTVKVAFSEPVTNFTASSVSITNGNGRVKSVVPADGLDYTYWVKIEPVGEGDIPVMVMAGAVADLAGNANVASVVLTRTYLIRPRIAVTGTKKTSSGAYELVVTAEGSGVIAYCWHVDGAEDDPYQWWMDTEGVGRKVLTGAFTTEGIHVVDIFVEDDLGQSEHVSWEIVVERGEEPDDIDFGGGVTLAVDPATHETNEVRFVAVDFRPGDVSTFVMSGFTATEETIEGLKMLFVVRETIDGERRSVKVNPNASYDLNDSKNLTVTIPAEATMKKDVSPAEPCDSFFVFGVEVDNEE